MIGRFCIIRTYSAGVHAGVVVEAQPNPGGTWSVKCAPRCRIWQWANSFTLDAVANHGVEDGSRLSEDVEEGWLTQVIEVIPCTEKAENSIRRFRRG